MTLHVVHCEQGSEQWFRVRAGMPTASEFGTVLAPRAGKDGKMRQTYLRKLAGEVITGEPMENYSNGYMERGKLLEHQARDLYSERVIEVVEQVGFVHCDERRCGCSPDSLVGDAGVLEIKTKAPHLLIPCLEKDEFPLEHKAQCQGVLWITGREWVDLAVYYPNMPFFVKRAARDEDYIKKLADAVAMFNEELDETVKFVRSYGRAA
jgi:hypothetical protein